MKCRFSLLAPEAVEKKNFQTGYYQAPGIIK